MKTRPAVLALCLLVFVAGCAGVEARYTYNQETDFSLLKTYAWIPGLVEKIDNQIHAGYYVEAMDAQLASKGFILDPQNPDFVIRTHPPQKYKEVYLTLYGEKVMEKGVLAVEFVDSKTGKMIWEGVAEAYLPGKISPENAKKKISRGAGNLLKGFPPPVRP